MFIAISILIITITNIVILLHPLISVLTAKDREIFSHAFHRREPKKYQVTIFYLHSRTVQHLDIISFLFAN
jgi:hypothetical protein